MLANRTRERSNASEERSYYVNWYHNGSSYYSEPGLHYTVPSQVLTIEQMTDSTGRDRRAFRACEHYKCYSSATDTYPGWATWVVPGSPSSGTWDPSPTQLPTRQIWNSGVYNGLVPNLETTLESPWCSHPSWVPALATYVTASSLYHVNDPADPRPLVDRSLSAMLPSIHEDTNGLVNDIIELKDLRYVGTSARRILTSLSALSRNKLTLRMLSKTVSDPYLTWSFGIAPIIRDIAGVSQALQDARVKLNRLLANRNKPLTKHFQTSLSGLTDGQRSCGPYTPPYYLADSTPVTGKTTVTYGTKRFNATLQYTYKLDGLTGSDGDVLNAFLDDLGVNLNPAIIWNHIRWTFVLDWIVNVSSWIDQFKRRNIEPVVVIRQYCYSFDVARNVHCETHKGTAFDFYEHAYKRVLYWPDYIRAITTSGLSSREFSLLAALGSSRGL